MVVQDLFQPNENPVGKFINIDSSVFKVIGVFKDLGGDNEERVVVIPYTTRQLIEKNNNYVDQIRVSYKRELGYVGGIGFENKLKIFSKREKIY